MSMTLREFLGTNLRSESRGVPVRVRAAVVTAYVCFIAAVTYFAVSLAPFVTFVLVLIAYALGTWCAVWLLRSYRRRHPAPEGPAA